MFNEIIIIIIIIIILNLYRSPDSARKADITLGSDHMNQAHLFVCSPIELKCLPLQFLSL